MRSFPNPAREGFTCRFALATPSRVRLEVVDLQGRRMATIAPADLMDAGQHDIRLSTTGWRPGVYLYQLEGEGQRMTGKLVVVK